MPGFNSYNNNRVAPPGTEWDPTRGGYVGVGQAGKPPGAGTYQSPQNPYNPGSPAQFAPQPGANVNGNIGPDTESPALIGLKAQTAVQTGAEKDILGTQAGIGTAARGQEAEIAARRAQQEAQYGTNARTQQGDITSRLHSQQTDAERALINQRAGIDTSARSQEAGIGTAARTQEGDIASRAAAAQAGYGSAARQQEAGYGTAARTQAGDIASRAAEAQAGYGTAARTQEEQLAEQRMKSGAGLQAEAEKRRLGYINQLIGGQGGLGGGIQPVPPVDFTSATANAFARAKDRAGQMTQGALTGLRDAYAGTGNVGAYEQGAARAVGSGASQLGDTNRELAIQEAEAQNKGNLENYRGNLAQWQTKMNQIPAYLSGLVNARY